MVWLLLSGRSPDGCERLASDVAGILTNVFVVVVIAVGTKVAPL